MLTGTVVQTSVLLLVIYKINQLGERGENHLLFLGSLKDLGLKIVMNVFRLQC